MRVSVIYLRDYSEANSGSRRASLLHEHRDSAAVPSEVPAAPSWGRGWCPNRMGTEFGQALVHTATSRKALRHLHAELNIHVVIMVSAT